MKALRRTLVVVAAVVGMSVGVGSTAVAAPNPNGTGQPASGQNPAITCQNIAAANPGTKVTPGNTVNAPGSPFDPTGTAGGRYAGSGPSLDHANSSKAVSEYDIACYQQSVNH
jgi:hypothetical protein